MPGEAGKLAASVAAADEAFSSAPAGAATFECPLRQNWIEIELVGPDGKGVPFEPYEIRLADRTVLSGKLDGSGFRRIERLPAGEHRVSFPRQQGNWVEVELVDEDGVPVAFEPFVVEDDSGRKRSGFTDDQGYALVGGLTEGSCKVSFPERQWQHRLEIELVHEDGTPAAGAAYRVHAPEGKIVEGLLDKNGFAMLPGLDPGDCTVEFPGLENG